MKSEKEIKQKIESFKKHNTELNEILNRMSGDSSQTTLTQRSVYIADYNRNIKQIKLLEWVLN